MNDKAVMAEKVVKTEELVSVLMCVYNEPLDYICKSVTSIIRQTYRNIEYIIVIDHPNRQDIVSYLEKIGDDRIHYYINEKNLGLIASLNKGLQLCHGKYIARMDADDIAFRTRLEEQYTYMRKHDVDILGGSTININEAEEKCGEITPPICDRYIEKYIGLGGGLPHPTWFVKQRIYREMQGYRNIKSIEDYDFLIRGVLRGYRFGCLEKACLYYRKNTNGISQNNKGKQKVVSRILQRQYREKKVLTIEEIQNAITESDREIQKTTQYYKLTRKMWLAMKNRSVKDIEIQDIISIIFSRALYLDIINKIQIKVLYVSERIFMFVNLHTKKYVR